MESAAALAYLKHNLPCIYGLQWEDTLNLLRITESYVVGEVLLYAVMRSREQIEECPLDIWIHQRLDAPYDRELKSYAWQVHLTSSDYKRITVKNATKELYHKDGQYIRISWFTGNIADHLHRAGLHIFQMYYSPTPHTPHDATIVIPDIESVKKRETYWTSEEVKQRYAARKEKHVLEQMAIDAGFVIM